MVIRARSMLGVGLEPSRTRAYLLIGQAALMTRRRTWPCRPQLRDHLAPITAEDPAAAVAVSRWLKRRDAAEPPDLILHALWQDGPRRPEPGAGPPGEDRPARHPGTGPEVGRWAARARPCLGYGRGWTLRSDQGEPRGRVADHLPSAAALSLTAPFRSTYEAPATCPSSCYDPATGRAGGIWSWTAPLDRATPRGRGDPRGVDRDDLVCSVAAPWEFAFGGV